VKKALINYYSKNNLGDDLFIKIITSRYENIFSIIHGESTFTKSIKNLNVYKKSYIFVVWYKIIERITNKRNILLKKCLKYNDILIYIGGSIFIEGGDIPKWKKEATFYKCLNKYYYIVGSNVGPYKSKEFLKILNQIFSRAKDVCFRDSASYELFKNLNSTRVASDIVFSMDISKYNIKNNKIAVFSIINCVDRFNENIVNKYDKEIVNMSVRLIQKGYEVVFMSFCKYEGDEVAINRILGKLDSNYINKINRLNYDGDLEAALSLIAKCEIVVASRFHATILGLLFSKKVLPMAYSDKTINILSDIKFSGDVVDIRKIDDFCGSEYNFDNIPVVNIDSQIKLGNLQFQELDKVLVRKNL
jgi:colanic acid/amylovoran biosynthesis protein